MDLFLMVNVTEFKDSEEQTFGPQVVDVTAYEDGTAEFGVQISGKEHRVFVRVKVSELVRIALTTESREEAP